MKKYDHFIPGMVGGIVLPLLAFVIYFSIHDPQLSLSDVWHRLIDSGVLTYYLSLSVISNLLLFFLFLKLNAERAARGVLGATILYAFAILIFKLQ